MQLTHYKLETTKKDIWSGSTLYDLYMNFYKT